MNEILKEIFSKEEVIDEEGNRYPLHSHTSELQCKFLQNLILDVQPDASLEVGLAYGVSTLAILDALKETGKAFRHIVIDPFQDAWKNIGLSNIRKAGYTEQVSFHPGFSDTVLPMLRSQGQRIQFAYVDSTKVFDILLTDTYFINKMLDVAGVLVLDDCGYPGVRKLTRFLSQHPCFHIYRAFQQDAYSRKRRLLKSFFHKALNNIPFKDTVLPGYNFKSDAALGVDYHSIAFKKVKEDDRNWDWFKSF